MSGVIFTETLRRNWRQIIFWGGLLGVLGLYIMIVIPDIEALEQYAGLLESLPPAFTQMMGVSSAAALATPEGFLSFGFFGYSVLLMAVYAVISGLNVTANEEDDGIMDVVLSLPVPRWRLVLEKFAAYTLLVMAIILLAVAGLWLGTLTSSMEFNISRIIESGINMVPSILLMIAVTMFLAAVFRRKSTAVALAAAIIVGSYFLDFVGKAASGALADTLQAISFFSYYETETVMMNGLNFGNVTILLVVTGLLVTGTVWAFNRRDVGL